MQLPEKVREVTSSGVEAQTAFQISIANQAHIKSILRDNIYSDKLMAVLREYAANAWDAHRMAGKPDLPIEVHVPDYSDMNLIIKDFGPGLSHDDVFNIFTQYGASTKRNTNDAVGMLGIGSKSGFAYSDTFTIVSRHGGKARTYVAMLDEADNDALNLLNEADCGDDTGLTIQIAARKEDVFNFRTKATQLFQHFNPRPKINIELPAEKPIRSKLTHGIIFDKAGSTQDAYSWREPPTGIWHAVMGCVPYLIDMSQLVDSSGTRLVSEGMYKVNGLLNFDIGEIQVNASREGLKYSTMTKEALVKKFELLLEEFIKVVLDEIDNLTGTSWEKRNKAITLLSLGLGKEQAGEWAHEKISLDPKTFEIPTIHIRGNARLVLARNVGLKKIDNYMLKRDTDYVVRPRRVTRKNDKGWDEDVMEDDGIHYKYYSWDEIMPELEALLVEKQLDGMPMVEITTLHYHTPYYEEEQRRKRIAKPADPKHAAKFFKFLDSKKNYGKSSDKWDISDHAPTAEDGFVILSYFEVVSPIGGYSGGFYHSRAQDYLIAKTLGIPLPDIYGYKTTDRKPIKPGDVVGLHYPDWRKKWLENIPKEIVNKFRDEQAWLTLKSNYGMDPITLGHTIIGIGKDHVISKFYRKMHRECLYKKRKQDQISVMTEVGLVKMHKSPAYSEYAALCSKYPILGKFGFHHLGVKSITEAKNFQKYVQLLDAEQTIPVTSTTTPTEPMSSEPEVKQP